VRGEQEVVLAVAVEVRQRNLHPAAASATDQDVSELGEYALQLFDQTLTWAEKLNLPDVYNALQAYIVTMAQWIAEHGGRIFVLEPVVDACAQSANRTQDPARLLRLYQSMRLHGDTVLSYDFEYSNNVCPKHNRSQ
jgi:hypothetical protein